MKSMIFAASLSLMSCTALVPETLQTVAGIDPLTADPADIALRLTLPTSVGIVPGTATLHLGARNRSGASVGQSFDLDRQGDVFAVAERDHDRLHDLQRQIGVWKSTDPSGTKGSLSLAFTPCRTGEVVPEDARASVGIRVVQNGAFLPLVQDGPVRGLLKEVSSNGFEPC